MAGRDSQIKDAMSRYLKCLVSDLEEEAKRFHPLKGLETEKSKPSKKVELPPISVRPWQDDKRDVEDKKGEEKEIIATLMETEKVVVIGDPGAGKTTSLQKLAIKYAKNVLEDENSPFPVFIELSGYGKGKDLFELIRSKIRGMEKESLEKLLEDGNFCLIFDGINEVSEKFYDDSLEDMKNFISDYGGNKFIFSSRKFNYQDDLGIDTLEILDLTEDEIQGFIKTYFNYHDIEGSPQDFFDSLDTDIKELIRNPFMLEMLISVYIREGKIPENRWGLTDDFINWIFKTEAEKRKTFTRDEMKEDFPEIISYLAFKMVERGEVGISEDDARNYVKERLSELIDNRYIGEDEYKYTVKKLMKEFKQRILVKGGREVRFFHQMIRDYFTAFELEKRWKNSKENDEEFDEFIAYLKWEEPIVLMAGMLKPPGSCALVERLAKRDPFLAARCLAVGECGDAKVQEQLEDVLLKLMKSRFESNRWSATIALGEIKSERAVEPFIEALKDEDNYVRKLAAEELGKIKSKRVEELLIEVLKDEDSGVRRSAAGALGRIGSERVVVPLIEALNDKDIGVRWWAANALGKIKSERTVEPLIKALKDEDRCVRMRAADALGEIKSKCAVEPLIGALKDEDSGVQGKAAEALGEIKSKCAAEPLIGALKDEDNGVRGRAAEALGEMKSERAVELLIETLKDEDSGVRGSAAGALGRIGSERVVVPLIETLNDKDRGVRMRAAYALGEIKSKRAVEPFIGALKDEDGSVQVIAAYALGEIKSKRAVEPLIGALKDEDGSVRVI